MSKKTQVMTYPWRHRVLLGSLVLVMGFLLFRALHIQVLDNEFLQGQGDARHLRTLALPAHRGMLLDRNGEALAVSTPVASIWANPQSVPLDDKRLRRLCELLGLDLAEVKRELKERRQREFVYLKRHVAPDLEQAVVALDLPGVAVQREFRRYYPTGEVSGHVLGFTDIDDQGQEGLERVLDTELRGKPGKQRVVKDRLGRIVDAVDLLEPPVAGGEVRLSIDRRLQFVAYRELKQAVQRHGAKSGSLVLLDSMTGEVLAMVNQPAFNPNNRSARHGHLYRNRAISDVFEPGSVIKPFTIAAALASDDYESDSVIDTAPGYFRVSGSTISDKRNYGKLDLTGILRNSSNVGVSRIALSIPAEELWATLSDVGLGTEQEDAVPGEVVGSLPFYGELNDVEKATLSFGYGLAVTPLQLARAYSVLANDGMLKPLTFHNAGDAGEGRRVMQADIARQVRAMLEVVVDDGTGRAADVEGYRIAGKTGTAKISGKGGYLEKRYRAVFAGIAPASRPRLVAVVVIDEPSNGKYYASQVAAPVFSRVVAAALRLMNIPPDDLPEPQLRVAEALQP